MINWTPEGENYKEGINFYLDRNYFRVVYKSKDIKYFRIRWIPSLRIFYYTKERLI